MNFSTRICSNPRLAVAAFLTLLALMIPAVIQTVDADAAPTASIAKKKKCKKGYKKVKGKCKKQQSSTGAAVESVSLSYAAANGTSMSVKGDLKMAKPFAGDKNVTIVLKTGDGSKPNVIKASGSGSKNVHFEAKFQFDGVTPVLVYANVDGKISTIITVE